MTAVVPFTRPFFRGELGKNEGWNVENAALVSAHQPLYPTRYAWTTVNYPMLSFAVLAELHRITHDYIFTARALSLLSLVASSVLVGQIVLKLTASRRPALLAGLFCLALFCVAADYPIYVGMDDPQMFAQVFLLSGLLVYLTAGKRYAGLAIAALLFVVGLCIKQNLIEFPLAVLLDLILISRRRAIWFGLSGLAFEAFAVLLQLHYGGPFFLDELLMPRNWSIEKALQLSGIVLGPLLLPLAVALCVAFALRRRPQQRVAGILLALSLLSGGVFIGGQGVSINMFFGTFLAICILVGQFLAAPWPAKYRNASLVPLALFAWFLIPWILVPSLSDPDAPRDGWNPVLALAHSVASQARFDQEVGLLRSHPGPALCESILRCYMAGKPYVYDPFNATSLIDLGKLDPSVVANAILNHQFAAVQLSGPLEDKSRSEWFAPAILAAIRQSYRPVLQNEDGTIYLPVSEAITAQRIPAPHVLSDCPWRGVRSSASDFCLK
jgi:hypothetical protein